MRIADLNWMQVEEYLQSDDRAVVPLGSVEQHAYLSLAVDEILAERVAIETYGEMIRSVGDDDPTTRTMLEGILAMEEEHADDMANVLEEIHLEEIHQH